MTAMEAEPNTNHPAVSYGKLGVLLVNLGTPDGTDVTSMRRYLREFLSDRRVIEWSRLFWYPILYGIVLNTRPRKVGKAYELIWNKELNESWLRTYTRNQAALMTEAFGGQPQVIVDWAMRYGRPSIASRLDALQKAGCERILVFPLYPQYAAATTATVNDKAFEALLGMRWQPALRTVPPYHDDPVYIDALATSITKHLATLDWEPELVLASFHGIPKSYFEKGDPYYCQCQKTARLLRERLGWPKEKLQITFQSRFGPEEWLQPYTDATVERLAKEGVKKIAVINPGFVSDCLETLEEIAGQAAESFHHNGGEKFAHIPCLNDSPEGMAVLNHVVRRELEGWLY
ncbi:ferrochelatase [Sinorhizobium medicae]|uniref:Ferrochelatase n=2 Tax=Sinorhizobium medicae TaxID=110321 RepID=A0A508WX70_9HYPH|nr:ferrochelatase [Sinorhizobium medicae]ABR61521.1 Ferrochelatase [Sinorhizobium medicae WSM419]MBO1942998.1 ferrochelatase [Sinorhizobium medicae]MBO1959550.1 ferrochelatase [Sinorhizobium medicae]MDX0405246.1 ferrochelatase [Sinorhizobium medicae]MDX0410769.1 ferrochelatase [Sinorhizobium medicae]